MTQHSDNNSPGSAVPDRGEGALPGAQVPSWWQEVRQAKLTFTWILVFPILGPLVFLPIVLLDPARQSVLDVITEAILTAWMGPSFILVIVIGAMVVNRRTLRRVVLRQSSENGAMITSMVAARYRHHQAADVPDPLKAAVLDIGAYLKIEVPIPVAGAWILAGADWHARETNPGQLPELPTAFINIAQAAVDSQAHTTTSR